MSEGPARGSGPSPSKDVREGLEEQTLQHLMQAAQEGVVVHDGKSVLRANEPAAQLLGYSPEQLAGMPLYSLVAPESADLVRKHVQSGFQGSYESCAVRRDGSRVKVLVTVRGLRVGGKDLRIAYITAVPKEPDSAGEVRLSPAEIRKLVEADQLKTRILNVAAHELNTPITPLRLQLHLLLSGALGTLEQRQRHALEVVDRNVNRLSGLVSEILDVSRLQAGRMRIQAEPLSAEEVIREAVESFAETARRVGVSLGVEVAPGLAIQADRERMQQVMFNLISNALKFTAADGHVDIMAQAKEGMAEIRVRDSGIGMTPEQLSRLFQPFSQVHDTAQMEVPGTGLGLFICRGIIEAMGGRIDAFSEGPDHGSTFRFTLPLATTPPKASLAGAEIKAVMTPREALAKRLRELI